MTSNSRSGSELPLDGITVVDLTQVLAGPHATMLLGDLGAEVIKIEAVGRGDRARSIEPSPQYFDTVNRNKKSIELDLKSNQGQNIALDLLESADVFVESTKSGRTEAYGLTYADVKKANDKIIYCTINGFGSDSPYKDLPAWDFLIQAMSGIMGMTGKEDTPPIWSGLPSGDLAAAMYAVQSIITSLYAQEIGKIDSEHITVPMMDSAVSWLSIRAGHTFGTGEPFPRNGVRHPSAAPFGVYNSKEGRFAIAAGTDSLWKDLCTTIERTDLLDDDRFSDMQARVENRDELVEELSSTFKEKPTDFWVEKLQSEHVPAGPIHDTKTVWDDEHVKRHELKQELSREGLGDATVIDNPVDYNTLSTEIEHPPERLGESTESVLSSLGYTGDEIASLRSDGIIGEKM